MTSCTDPEAVAREAITALLHRPLDGIATADITRERLDGWDSLKHMEILLAVEEACGVQFSEAEFAELTSLARIAAAVRTRHAA